MKREVCRQVKLTDNINVASLSILDQLRLLVSKVSNNDEAELDAQVRYNTERMRKLAALKSLLETAVENMIAKGADSVSVGVSSEFLPYIDEVVSSTHGLGRYYDITVRRKDLPYKVKHRFTVIIKRRR